MGPKKSASVKKKNDKKKNEKEDKERMEIVAKLKMILKLYEKQCQTEGSAVDIKLKSSLLTHITDGKHLVRFILQGDKPEILKDEKREMDASAVDATKSAKNKAAIEINNDITTNNNNNNNIIITSTTTFEALAIKNTIIKEKVPEELPIKIYPIIKSLRSAWYKPAKELYFWDLDIPREDITELITFLSQPSYNIEYLEILDCNINQYTLRDFSKCLSVNQTLTSIVLDFTSLQYDGLVALCSGLCSTKSVTKLSLCYCSLTPLCGEVLGDLVSQTTISDLYLDGNNLECIGIIHLLQMFVDKAEQESIERKDCANRLSQSAVGLFAANAPIVALSRNIIKKAGSESAKDKSTNDKGRKKKKMKKKKKFAKPKVPPKPGPWLNVLHAANVGMDNMGLTRDDDLLYDCLSLIGRWIMYSEDLKEIDIEDNLIGELGGREMLEALRCRKEGGLKPIYLKVSHRLDVEVFKHINTLASGKSKRGGKKKKKKKGGPGKRRV